MSHLFDSFLSCIIFDYSPLSPVYAFLYEHEEFQNFSNRRLKQSDSSLTCFTQSMGGKSTDSVKFYEFFRF